MPRRAKGRATSPRAFPLAADASGASRGWRRPRAGIDVRAIGPDGRDVGQQLRARSGGDRQRTQLAVPYRGGLLRLPIWLADRCRSCSRLCLRRSSILADDMGRARDTRDWHDVAGEIEIKLVVDGRVDRVRRTRQEER
jgi:hypothetical protein